MTWFYDFTKDLIFILKKRNYRETIKVIGGLCV